ncbi:CLUMA_CG019339, isoform A [Clunio marinus]|uniref:CLUMA_CG019339, isoform A n=1 Tax=Clunio marinus TaxID=568069 RepID=A0A1J1J2W0_9DIPT|nr:CLUMA_CG019339, isoform A [Clunio marinus]
MFMAVRFSFHVCLIALVHLNNNSQPKLKQAKFYYHHSDRFVKMLCGNGKEKSIFTLSIIARLGLKKMKIRAICRRIIQKAGKTKNQFFKSINVKTL